MDLRDMHYLIALYKHGNIGKAADEVHVSQPALSKFLQQQNQYYGEKLFMKNGHKLQITEFGQTLLKYAQQFTALEESMNHEISSWQSRNKPFTIASPGGTGRYVMSIVFPKFTASHPEVDLRYMDIHTILAYDKIRSGEIDAASCGVPADNDDFSWKSIYREEAVLAIRKDHPLVKEAVMRPGFTHPWIDLHYLKDETFILLAKTQWPGMAAETIFKQINFTPKKVTRITDIGTAALLTSAGIGATFMIDKYHTFMLDQNQVAILSCGTEPVYHHAAILWKKDRILPDYCDELFQEISDAAKHVAGVT